jgi:hypothetical protein
VIEQDALESDMEKVGPALLMNNGQVVLARRTAEGKVVSSRIDTSNCATGSECDPSLQSYDLVYVPGT